VDRLPEHQRGEIYTLGVILQNIEGMILRMIEARTPDDDKA